MAAGEGQALWTMDNIVAVIDAAALASMPRDLYKKTGISQNSG